MTKLDSAAQTHTGRRSGNEDAFGACEALGLFVVADGMGGYEGGERASRIVVDALCDFFRRNDEDPDATWPFALDKALGFAENMLSAAIRLAHLKVCAEKIGPLARMGSTVVALTVRDGRAILAHVGDSRIYRLRAGELTQLTVDHSLYAELCAAGREVPSYADFPYKNVITRAVGMPEMEPELKSVEVVAGDAFLLCSDGLMEGLDDAALACELAAASDAEDACKRLVEAAYEAGAKDNITALVVRLLDEPAGDQPASASASVSEGSKP